MATTSVSPGSARRYVLALAWESWVHSRSLPHPVRDCRLRVIREVGSAFGSGIDSASTAPFHEALSDPRRADGPFSTAQRGDWSANVEGCSS